MPVATDQPRLQPIVVLRDALRVYRRHCLALWLTAIVVFTPLAAVDGLLEEVAHDGGTFLAVVSGSGQTVVHMVGSVLYAGIVAAAVIAWREHGRRPGVAAVARTLPWGTILALDLIIPVVTLIGLLLLVVPGIVFFSYFGLAPAVAKVDHVSARAALRHSLRLVRGSFWRVTFVFFLIVVVAGAIEQALQTGTPQYVTDVAINLVVQVVFAPLFGLATVLMVFNLRRGG